MIPLRLLTGLLILCLSACAGSPAEPPPPLPPTVLNLQIQTGMHVNPDAAGKAAPVVLRLYELREQSSFLGADFFPLFDKEQATLAADLVRKQEFVIKPGESRPLQIETAADTRFIGFFAAFRELDHAQWRSVAPLVLHQNNAVILKLENNELAVTRATNP